MQPLLLLYFLGYVLGSLGIQPGVLVKTCVELVDRRHDPHSHQYTKCKMELDTGDRVQA